jgi:di/tricarboxylate transporter
VAVGPQEKIVPGDRLFFTGLPETIVELQRTPGLSLLKESDFNLKEYDSDAMKTFEAVISPSSPLIGQNVRESQFRNRYGAVIIAIHRNGERIRRKIGDVVLRAGDTLLILTKKEFFQKWYYSKDFNLVSESVMVPSKPRIYAIISLAILSLMIVVMASGILPILLTVCIAAILLVVSKCITVQDAWKSVEWNVLLVIASAFGISRALMNSGVADVVANGIIDGLGSMGIIGLLAGVYFATSLYTEIITNNAAAAIMFPIAFALTSKVGIDPRPFFIAIMIAASASFATPIGYQTNLMVYGPGGYKFTDFMKIGIPMNLFVGVIAVLLIYSLFFG